MSVYHAILWKKMKSRVWVVHTLLLRNTFRFDLSTSVKMFHAFAERRKKNPLQSLLSISMLKFLRFLLLRLKGALLLFFKDMQMFSLSVLYLHSDKLGLLNALGRIKVEVCFERIQRGW